MEEYLSPSQIPKELLEECSLLVSRYLVGFVRLSRNAYGSDADVGGSGTLVQIENTYGILTADHVVQDLKAYDDIGIVLPTGPTKPHKITIKREVTHSIRIPRGTDDAEGPDLGLLVLPPVEIQRLRAIQSAYNLGLRRETMLVVAI